MAFLASHRNIKRTRPDDDLDSDSENEPFLTNDNWPRFIVLSSASEEKPLSKLSPFAVQKGFQAIAGPLKSTKRAEKYILPRGVLQKSPGLRQDSQSFENGNVCGPSCSCMCASNIEFF